MWTIGGYMKKTLEAVLNKLDIMINALNEQGFKLYDEDNRDFYISNVTYCDIDDRLIVSFKEDK